MNPFEVINGKLTKYFGKGMETVEVPEEVKVIGSDAFSNRKLCGGIKKIIVPDSVTKIERNAFSGCSDMIEIRLPDHLDEIADSTFYNCSSLKTINIPQSVKTIGKNAFWYCRSLTELVIPNGVQEIGKDAFYNCSDVKTVVIPPSVRSIGESAFDYMENLEEVRISDLAAWLSVTMTGMINAFRGETKLLLNGKEVSDLVVPEGTDRIREYTFSRYQGLKSVILPEGVEEIGQWAFGHCSNLEEITIPKSLKRIGNNAFYNTGIKRILIKDIAGWASVSHHSGYNELIRGENTQLIYGGEPVRDLRIPGSTGCIEAGAFTYCSTIVSLIIDEGVAEIGASAFRECKNLAEVTLPASITKIGWGAFASCDSLERINIADPEAWSKIEFDTGRSVIGKTVNPIPESAVLYYQGKKLSETAAETVIERSDTVLAGHNEIVNVIIREGVTEIAPHAFENCSNLKSITIPGSVRKIGEQAFSGCAGLEEVHLSDLSSWLSVSLDQGFYSIRSNPFSTGAKMYIGDRFVEDVLIPEDITVIGDQLRNYRHMKTLKFHNRIERIMEGAFAGCTGLKKVELPEGITEIGQQWFYGCKNLVSVQIPDNYRSIESNAFKDCAGLKSIKLPVSLERIGEHAFSDSGLTEITIPEHVNKVESWAFSSCSHLETVRINSKQTEYGYSVFAWNCGLKNIQFPEGFEIISSSMFSHCGLRSFAIPDTVRMIESDAFDDNRFEELFIPDSVSIIDSSAIGYDLDYDEEKATTNISIPGTIDEIDNKAFGYRFAGAKWFVDLSVRGHKVTPKLSKFLNTNKQNLKIIFVDALSNEIPAQYRREMTKYWAEKSLNNESIDPAIIKSYIKYIQNHKQDWLDEPKPEDEAVIRFMMRGKMLTATETETLVNTIREMPELKASLVDYQNSSFSFEDYDRETEKEFKKMQRDAENLAEPGSQKYINAVWTAARKNPYVKTLKMTTQSVEFPQIVGKTEITGIADGFTFGKGEDEEKKTGSAAADVTDIFIPESYTYIGKNALYGCRNGVRIHVSSLDQWLKIQPADSFSLPKEFRLIVAGQEITELVIPGDCETINEYLFSGVSGIRNAVIQNGVKKIGNEAFCMCSDLQSIHIPPSVSYVGSDAFEGCKKLKEVYLEDIGKWTDAVVLSSPFQSGACLYVEEKQCTKLVIPEYTERIREAAFSGCRGIREIDIGNTVKYIEAFAFSECTDLRLVMIPESVESIGTGAFEGCCTTVVCNTLYSQMLRAFPYGTLIYARAHSDVMKDKRYRIRPLGCFSREMIGDEPDASLKGLVFAVTGDIRAFPERDGFIEYIRTCGGQYSGSITKKTTHLVTNQKSAQTTKHVKAKQLDLPIISESEFFKTAFPEREKDLKAGNDTNDAGINDLPEKKGSISGGKDPAIYLLAVEKECKKTSSLDKWIDEILSRMMKKWKKDLRDRFYRPEERLLIKDLTYDNLYLLDENIKTNNYNSYVIDRIKKEKEILDLSLENMDREEKVVFMDKHFVTTGFGGNKESVADQIRLRGGFFHDSMVKNADYLVISFDEPGLAKLQKAVKMRKEGSGVRIVSEFQFRQALLDSSNCVKSCRELQISNEERERQKLEAKEREEYLRQQAIEQKQLEAELRRRKEALEKEAIELERKRKQEERMLAEQEKLKEKREAREQKEAERLETALAAEKKRKEKEILLEEARANANVLYAPGEEPEPLHTHIQNFMAKLDEAYPDHVIVNLGKDHKHWDERVTELYRKLGYADRTSFLEAYGFKANSDKGGRPTTLDPEAIITELKKRYPDGTELKIQELMAANKDLKIKTLQNNSNEIFGMSLVKYLKDQGILLEKKPEAGVRNKRKPLEKETVALELERLKQEAQELAELRKKRE